MRRKHISVWIVCIAMLVCSLSACSLFGGKESETAQNQTTQEAVSALTDGQKTSAGTTVSREQDSQAEQSTPGQTANSEKQDNPSSVAELAADVELPEIEIPIADDNNRNDERDSGHESAVSEPSGTAKPSSESEPTSKPESKPEPTVQPSGADKPTSTPSSSENPQAESPVSNETKPTPEAPSEPPVSTPPQADPDPDPEPNNSDIFIQDNGDILLPEVP